MSRPPLKLLGKEKKRGDEDMEEDVEDKEEEKEEDVEDMKEEEEEDVEAMEQNRRRGC